MSAARSTSMLTAASILAAVFVLTRLARLQQEAIGARLRTDFVALRLDTVEACLRGIAERTTPHYDRGGAHVRLCNGGREDCVKERIVSGDGSRYDEASCAIPGAMQAAKAAKEARALKKSMLVKVLRRLSGGEMLLGRCCGICSDLLVPDEGGLKAC